MVNILTNSMPAELNAIQILAYTLPNSKALPRSIVSGSRGPRRKVFTLRRSSQPRHRNQLTVKAWEKAERLQLEILKLVLKRIVFRLCVFVCLSVCLFVCLFVVLLDTYTHKKEE